MSIYEDFGILVYFSVLAAICGAVMGSFLNCAAWRIAHGESFLRGKSHCISCGHPLKAYDLVPVFSWVFLKGKCRYCGEKISARYPLSELFMALMWVLCLLRFDLSAVCVRNLIFGCVLFCLSLVDFEVYLIPDSCHVLAAIVWLAALPSEADPLKNLKNGLLGGVVIAGGVLILSLLMDRILKKESMGGGDIKLLFICGLYLGLISGFFMLLAACICGLLFAAAGSRKNEQGQLPFGPAIAFAAWGMLLYGQPLADWYLSLL